MSDIEVGTVVVLTNGADAQQFEVEKVEGWKVKLGYYSLLNEKVVKCHAGWVDVSMIYSEAPEYLIKEHNELKSEYVVIK